MLKKLFLFLFAVFFVAGCGRLGEALRLAGENRGELEKVLEHYADEPQKLRAAEFIIENMPGHKSYDPEKIGPFREQYEAIMFDNGLSIDDKKRLLEELSMRHDLDAITDEDVHLIKADFLIRDIDRSFEIWENEPYCRHLTFEQFCELILPYKVVELQELDDWKSSLADVPTLLTRVVPDDETTDNTRFAAEVLSRDLFAAHRVNHVHDYRGYTLYNKNTMRAVKFGTCDNYSLPTIAVMRAKGIPACFERIQQWAQKATGHAWHTILNDNGAYMPSPWNLESMPGDAFFPEKKIPKIFRDTWAANPFYEKYTQRSKLKLPRFLPFRQDVTDLYIGTADISVPISRKGLKERYVYLAAFDNTDWNPMDVAVAGCRKVRFESVGLGVAYIILGYDGERLVPISEPFLVHTSGEVEYLTASEKRLDGVRLTKKYPTGKLAAQTEDYLIGGQIHVAGRPDFSDADTLYTIENQQYPDLVKPDTARRYRYVRYYQYAPRKHCSLAEMEVLVSGSNAPATGEIIASEREMERPDELAKVFDGDWLTAFTSNHWNGWVGLDLGTPMSIDGIRIVPRSNGNSVRAGDHYELKYWGDGGWVSLGEQVAKERFLIYDGVPTGALLLLSNTTRGREERIFTLDDGKIRWW